MAGVLAGAVLVTGAAVVETSLGEAASAEVAVADLATGATVLEVSFVGVSAFTVSTEDSPIAPATGTEAADTVVEVSVAGVSTEVSDEPASGGASEVLAA